MCAVKFLVSLNQTSITAMQVIICLKHDYMDYPECQPRKFNVKPQESLKNSTHNYSKLPHCVARSFFQTKFKQAKSLMSTKQVWNKNNKKNHKIRQNHCIETCRLPGLVSQVCSSRVPGSTCLLTLDKSTRIDTLDTSGSRGINRPKAHYIPYYISPKSMENTEKHTRSKTYMHTCHTSF